MRTQTINTELCTIKVSCKYDVYLIELTTKSNTLSPDDL